MTAPERTGLVLAGGGARGAYEAGAASVLVPRMAADGWAPDVLVGTSAGALNVVGLAGSAHLGWQEASARLVQLWSSVVFDDVARLPRSIPRDVLAYLAQLAGGHPRLASLLDTAPLRGTLERLLPLDDVHRNIESGLVAAVAVATTSAATGGTVVFVEKAAGVALPADDATRNISYVETRLGVDHVLASAAVPVAFRAVHLPHPEGWYLDGGIRLNTPLKPALALGCTRLGVVATHPASWPHAATPPVQQVPDVFRAASLTLTALLTDRMVEDLRTLTRVNAFVAQATGSGSDSGYRHVPVRFAGPAPDQAHQLGALAQAVQVDVLRERDLWLLERLVGGGAEDHGELLSFLLFDEHFTAAAAALGAAHARA